MVGTWDHDHIVIPEGYTAIQIKIDVIFVGSWTAGRW
jgi:hypothetical protein